MQTSNEQPGSNDHRHDFELHKYSSKFFFVKLQAQLIE